MTIDLLKTCAADMTGGALHWAEPDEPLRTAALRMRDAKIRCLLVRPQPGQLPGILTSKDVVNLMIDQSRNLDDIQVGDAMTRPAICVPAAASLEDCVHLMRIAGVRRLPVLDGMEVVGLISSTDVFTALMSG